MGTPPTGPDPARRVRPSQAAYFGSWYAANRGSLAAKRRARYRGDPDYKARVLRASAARYEGIRLRRIAAGRPGVPRPRGLNRPIVRAAFAGGQPCEAPGRCGAEHPHGAEVREWLTLHPIGEFAARAERCAATLRACERLGVLPPPTYVDAAGRRWYAEAHMARVSALLRDFYMRGGWFRADLRAFVRAAGAPGAGAPDADQEGRPA